MPAGYIFSLEWNTGHPKVWQILLLYNSFIFNVHELGNNLPCSLYIHQYLSHKIILQNPEGIYKWTLSCWRKQYRLSCSCTGSTDRCHRVFHRRAPSSHQCSCKWIRWFCLDRCHRLDKGWRHIHPHCSDRIYLQSRSTWCRFVLIQYIPKWNYGSVPSISETVRHGILVKMSFNGICMCQAICWQFLTDIGKDPTLSIFLLRIFFSFWIDFLHLKGCMTLTDLSYWVSWDFW